MQFGFWFGPDIHIPLIVTELLHRFLSYEYGELRQIISMTLYRKLSTRLITVLLLPVAVQLTAFLWLSCLQDKIDHSQGRSSLAQGQGQTVQTLRQTQGLVVVLALVATASCAAMAFDLLRRLCKRMDQMHQNAMKMAQGEAGGELYAGAEEIPEFSYIFQQMSRALQRTSSKERAIVENIFDVVCTIDEKGCFASANGAAQDLLGVPAADIIGLPVLDLIAPVDKEDAAKFFEMARSQAGKRTIDLKVTHFSEKLIETRWTAHNMADENLLLCVVQDMTEGLKTERLKHELMSLVSHDLHAPVSNLQKTFALIKSGKHGALNDEGVNLLEHSERDCDRLIQLTADLLDESRLDDRQMELKIGRCAVDDLAAAAVESVSLLAASHNVLVVVDVPAVMVKGDATRLEQVISNLLSNAVKYSPEGGRVTLRASTANGKAVITVIDHGLGISSAKLDQVFERHSQVQDPGHQEPGTGLGLAISRALVELHGGTIWVESTVGEGSQFSFTVPLA
jgi:PAS domain S-box-containing protein